MNPLSNVRELLSQYANKAGLGVLQLDSEHQCALTYDEQYTINFTVYEEDNLLVLSANLGDMPITNKEKLFEIILEANGFSILTKGAALGLNQEANIITLTLALPATCLDYVTFVERLNEFVHVLKEWRIVLVNIQQGEVASSLPSRQGFKI